MRKVLRFLQRASYSTRHLVEMMLIIFIVSLALTALCSFKVRARPHYHAALARVQSLMDEEEGTFEDLFSLLPLLAGLGGEDVLRGTRFSDAEKRLFLAALRSWQAKDIPDPVLVAYAMEFPRVRYANRLLGDFWRSTGAFGKAIVCYEKEGGFPRAEVSRRRLLDLLINQERFEEVQALRDNPFFKAAFDPFVLRSLAMKERRLGELFKWSVIVSYSHLRWGLVVLVLFSGSLWFGLCMRLGHISPRQGVRLGLCLLATALGVASAHVTLLVSVVQEEWFGFIMQTELISGLIYAVAGIGLREELIKLLFVLPLVPFLVRRGQVLDWLIVPAFVGLGFAMQENVSYFHQSNSVGSIGRFLTANFLHISATGLAGQALCRFWRWPQKKGDDFLAMFVLVVLIHGLYDALMMIPALMKYGLFSFTAFVFLCYLFFGELRPLRNSGVDRFSLTSTFLLAVSLLFGATLAYLGTFVGMRSAVLLLFPVLIELAILVYMFVREFREPIV